MPTNYSIPQPNDASGVCPHCGGAGCRFCRKMTCPTCDGIIQGSDGCPTCLGTKHQFVSDLIQRSSISLPDPSVRPYAGERPHTPTPQIRISRRR